METAEIVRRLLSRPVTPERARKVLHLLERPSQFYDVPSELMRVRELDAYNALNATVTESVVAAHFARRTH